MGKTTLVLGASTRNTRTSYQAIHMLQEYDHPVIAVGRRAGEVDGVSIETEFPEIVPETVHTVTMYLNAENQKPFYDDILRIKPKRVFFNPGAENPELAQILEKEGIEVQNACTLVALRTSFY